MHGNADYISMSCLEKKVYYNIIMYMQLRNASPRGCSVPLPSVFSIAATSATWTGSARGRPASPRVLQLWHCSSRRREAGVCGDFAEKRRGRRKSGFPLRTPSLPQPREPRREGGGRGKLSVGNQKCLYIFAQSQTVML